MSLKVGDKVVYRIAVFNLIEPETNLFKFLSGTITDIFQDNSGYVKIDTMPDDYLAINPKNVWLEEIFNSPLAQSMREIDEV